MKITLRSAVCHLFTVLAIATLAACGSKVPEGSLVVPRGATISVRSSEAITAAGAAGGTRFQAELDSPLSSGEGVFAPVGTAVEGVVEDVGSEDGATEVELRLTRLRLSDSASVKIETTPMNRSASSAVISETVIESTMGLRNKIRYLAELEDAGGDSDSSDSGIGAIVPRDAQLVFTLSEDLVIPPSS